MAVVAELRVCKFCIKFERSALTSGRKQDTAKVFQINLSSQRLNTEGSRWNSGQCHPKDSIQDMVCFLQIHMVPRLSVRHHARISTLEIFYRESAWW